MADENPTCDACATPARTTTEEDAITEAAVLDFALFEHPDHLTPAELSLAINHGKGDFSEEDAINRALGRLIGSGLLTMAADLVVPTRPALCFQRLRRHL